MSGNHFSISAFTSAPSASAVLRREHLQSDIGHPLVNHRIGHRANRPDSDIAGLRNGLITSVAATHSALMPNSLMSGHNLLASAFTRAPSLRRLAVARDNVETQIGGHCLDSRRIKLSDDVLRRALVAKKPIATRKALAGPSRQRSDCRALALDVCRLSPHRLLCPRRAQAAATAPHSSGPPSRPGSLSFSCFQGDESRASPHSAWRCAR
jgi:hypothetical protein